MYIMHCTQFTNVMTSKFIVIVVVAVIVSISLSRSAVYSTPLVGEKDEEEAGELHQVLGKTRLGRTATYLIRKGEDNTSNILGLMDGGNDVPRSSGGGRAGGGAGEENPLINRHSYGDIFELEEAVTSNVWSTVPQTGTSGIGWFCITSDSQGINLAAGSNAGIKYSKNGGSTWTLSQGAPVSASGYAISWYAITSSSNGMYVVAGSTDCSYYPCQGQLWTSINYGLSFSLRVSYVLGVYIYYGSLAMSSDGTKLIVGVGGGDGLGVLLYTFNTGTGVVTQIGSTLSSVNGNSVIHSRATTSDSTFTKLAFGVFNGAIYYSSNGGNSWTISNAPTSVGNWYGITSSANGQYLAAGTYQYGIYYSNDGGATWTQSSPNVPIGSAAYIYGVASSATGQTMTAAVYPSNKIFISYDYGQSWQASNSPSANWYDTAISKDGGTMYGAAYNNGASPGIYKSNAVPSSQPSRQPTSNPSNPTSKPSCQPSCQPSSQPFMYPTMQPSTQPSRRPTRLPTSLPSVQPSMQPFCRPSNQPSIQPSLRPTIQPYGRPSMQPSSQPASKPSMQPSKQPSQCPSMQPFSCPTMQPSEQPSCRPSMQPLSHPSNQPSCRPSRQPSTQPTSQPSRRPSGQPTIQPSMQPSNCPTMQPSNQPSNQPSCRPSIHPSAQPSNLPSMQPSYQPSSLPSSQPSRLPSSLPSGQPSRLPTNQPTIQPSNKPTRQPSGQPTSNPTHSNSKKPSGSPTMLVGYAYSNKYDNGYSATYSFTNVGYGDKYNMFLEVQVLNTQLYGKSSSPNTAYINTQLVVGINKIDVSGACQLPYYNKTCKRNDYITCAINFRIVDTYINGETGGTVTILSSTTSATGAKNCKCPYNGTYPLYVKYTLVYNHGVPTLSPTRGSNTTIIINNSTIINRSENRDEVIRIGAPGTALPIIIVYALLYGLFGIVLVYIRRSDKTVTQHSYVSVAIDLLLLASQQISEFVLVNVMFQFDDGVTFKALSGVLMLARLSNFIPASYIKCKLAGDYLVDDHMSSNAKVYAILGTLSFFSVPMMKYLPWKESEFTKISDGVPSLQMYNIINWFSFANSCFSTVFQMSFLVYANRNALLSSSMETIYASVFLSILLLLVFLYESIIFRKRLRNFNLKGHDESNRGGDLESQDKSKITRPSVDVGISMHAISLGDITKTEAEDNAGTCTDRSSGDNPLQIKEADIPIFSETLPHLVAKIKGVYGYSQDMITPDVISNAARDLNVADECDKLVGYFNKAKFLCDALGI